MSPEQFTYWLNGFFEISDTNNLSEKQVQIIRDHLNLVFNKVTPETNKKPIYAELFNSGGMTPDRKDENMGYKPLDIRFTGTNNNPLCKQEIDWRDNPNFKQIKEETKYC
jgi:hypothetical protein